VRLEIVGESTELDRMVIEEISDPLVHIIRNAIDHGIETTSERKRKGKPVEGVIKLKAYHESNKVVIEITDDGSGIDIEKIKTEALKKDFVTEEELQRMGPKEILWLIMKPGFSSAKEVTKISGRGVGMDVVKENIERLNGSIDINSKPGEETSIRIKIPLTLAIIQALLVRVGPEIFTIPLAAVVETLRIFDGDTSLMEGVEVIHLRSRTIPLLRLSQIFNIEAASREKSFVVVVSEDRKKIGLVVDALIGQEEAVIKPLEDYLQEDSGFSGATILGDGRISLILDVYDLIRLSIDRQRMKQLFKDTAASDLEEKTDSLEESPANAEN
jgi:two-component system chemotaxis sensor kinase CheA